MDIEKEILSVLRENDTVFGRDSRFIALRIKKRTGVSLSNDKVGHVCHEMKNVVSVGTKTSRGRKKWRLNE